VSPRCGQHLGAVDGQRLLHRAAKQRCLGVGRRRERRERDHRARKRQHDNQGGTLQGRELAHGMG
jgi:hypothetical protein